MGCSDSKPIEVCESFEDKYSVSNIELGRGAFSVVMEGTLRKTGAKVAIKFVNTEASMNKTGLDFEVEIQKRLNHPNVIKLYDCYYTPGNYTIIEEYVSGHDLYDRVLLRNHYSEKDARDLMRILVNTVNYLHGMNVVHRDLKPENVLLTSPDSDSDIKICDFGFATYASRETLTEFKGTPNFVAPEVVNREAYGKPVDIWALGVILFVLLSGLYPFGTGDSDPANILKRVSLCRYTFDYEHWGDISPEAKDLIARILELDVKSRLNAEEILNHPWMLADEKLSNNNLIGLQNRLAVHRSLIPKRKSFADIDHVLSITENSMSI